MFFILCCRKNRVQLGALKINIHISTLNFYYFPFLTRVQIFLSTEMTYFQSYAEITKPYLTIPVD